MSGEFEAQDRRAMTAVPPRDGQLLAGALGEVDAPAGRDRRGHFERLQDEGDGDRCVRVLGAGLRTDVVDDLLSRHGWACDDARPPALVVLVASEVPDAAVAVRESADSAPVLVIAEGGNPSSAAALVAAGAQSVVSDVLAAQQVLAVADLTASGASFLPPELARPALQTWRQSLVAQRTVSLETLTPREAEVLQALVDGLTGKEIARRLGVSSKTVEAHKTSLYARLGVSGRSQAVALALLGGMG